MDDNWQIRELSTPYSTVFSVAPNRTVLTIHSDGRLEKGEAFASDDEGSKEIFDILSRYFPTYLAQLRQRAERAEAELAALKASLTN